MKFAQKYNADIEIYNTDGNLAVKLDYLKDSMFKCQNNQLIVYTNILSTELYDFLYEKEEDLRSDFEKSTSKNHYESYLVSNKQKNCKLIIKTYVQDEQEGVYKSLVYKVPKAFVRTNFDRINNSIGDPAKDPANYQIVFDILPFDDKGHLFTIYLEK
ncbi:MAG: hypothetical protein QJR05_13430 [Thermoanaerobacterium sp.]|nr:hypothetical protein [Thermoanaerobacterium sp.]